MNMHDVYFDTHGGDIKNFLDVPWIACSRFVAEKYHRAYGMNAISIYPFTKATEYKTSSLRKNVTFINPSEGKGLEIALKIAKQCPDIPFSFVETWFVPEHRNKVLKRIENMPNVTLRGRAKDMRKIYGKCKVLLAPSTNEEAFGMVATEAQVSGIPVVASTRGGLPEAVGPGGILADPDEPIEKWVSAVRKLWDNNTLYSELAEKALEYALRPEIQPSYLTEQWEKVLRENARAS